MSNKRTAFFAAGALACLGAVALAGSDTDIVWPTYDRVVYPGDSNLSCTALKAEIGRVDGHIKMMEVARDRVEANMRSAFDLDSYTVSGSGPRAQFAGAGNDEHIYANAREAIVASEKVATDRRNHLGNLLPVCKN